MRQSRPTERRSNSGFTLIELLVVIVILGVLVGLIVPAVMNAVGTAKNAAVSAEIQGLVQALAAFKNQYGDYPPSRIVCSETGKYDLATFGATAASPNALSRLAPRTLAALRRFWPRMDLRSDGSAPSIPGVGFYDFNGNGTPDSPYILSGAECLTFFLGGIPQTVGADWAVMGFAKNPANPMQSAAKVANRNPPFHEFVSSRLKTYPTAYNDGFGSPTGFPAFLDLLGGYDPSDGATPFYCYFSAYGGSGYDPDDCNMQETDSATSQPMKGAFVTSNAMSPTAGLVAVPGLMVSPAPNPYTAGPPIQTDASGSPETTLLKLKPRVWQNGQTFQIISAGRDRVFGIGGQYATTGNVKLPWLFVQSGSGYGPDTLQTQNANAAATGITLGGDARAREGDNLSNFSQGKLE